MSKRAKYLFMVFAILFAMSLCIASCVVSEEDGEKQFRLNPFVADKIEQGGEAGVGIAEILAPFLGPVGGIVAGGLAGGLALFKKFKPKLTHFQTKSELSHTVAEITVDIFEDLKKNHPKVWEHYSEKIRKECLGANINTKVLENFIRGLRGLPAKQ